MTSEERKQLQLEAVKVREGILTATHGAKSGHPGGSLSAADMFTYLYFKEMRLDPKNPRWEDRDRFVLSKGHTAPGLYSALANRGFFPVEDLPTLRHIDSYLQGHPNMNTVPGVDMSTGSLGQGLSAAAGMAKGAKFLNKDVNVYSIVGDGELAEGQIWEATMFAAHYHLDNLCIIVDVMCDKKSLLRKLYLEVNAPFPVQFLLYNTDEWVSMRKDAGSYASAIEKKGTILYGETTKGEH